jgi:hypothetical protein
MCRYNRRETTATLRHLNLDVRGKAPELAARLFEATAEARKAYDLKMKRSKAREAASGRCSCASCDCWQRTWEGA